MLSSTREHIKGLIEELEENVDQLEEDEILPKHRTQSKISQEEQDHSLKHCTVKVPKLSKSLIDKYLTEEDVEMYGLLEDENSECEKEDTSLKCEQKETHSKSENKLEQTCKREEKKVSHFQTKGHQLKKAEKCSKDLEQKNSAVSHTRIGTSNTPVTSNNNSVITSSMTSSSMINAVSLHNVKDVISKVVESEVISNKTDCLNVQDNSLCRSAMKSDCYPVTVKQSDSLVNTDQICESGDKSHTDNSAFEPVCTNTIDDVNHTGDKSNLQNQTHVSEKGEVLKVDAKDQKGVCLETESKSTKTDSVGKDQSVEVAKTGLCTTGRKESLCENKDKETSNKVEDVNSVNNVKDSAFDDAIKQLKMLETASPKVDNLPSSESSQVSPENTSSNELHTDTHEKAQEKQELANKDTNSDSYKEVFDDALKDLIYLGNVSKGITENKQENTAKEQNKNKTFDDSNLVLRCSERENESKTVNKISINQICDKGVRSDETDSSLMSNEHKNFSKINYDGQETEFIDKSSQKTVVSCTDTKDSKTESPVNDHLKDTPATFTCDSVVETCAPVTTVCSPVTITCTKLTVTSTSVTPTTTPVTEIANSVSLSLTPVTVTAPSVTVTALTTTTNTTDTATVVTCAQIIETGSQKNVTENMNKLTMKKEIKEDKLFKTEEIPSEEPFCKKKQELESETKCGNELTMMIDGELIKIEQVSESDSESDDDKSHEKDIKFSDEEMKAMQTLYDELAADPIVKNSLKEDDDKQSLEVKPTKLEDVTGDSHPVKTETGMEQIELKKKVDALISSFAKSQEASAKLDNKTKLLALKALASMRNKTLVTESNPFIKVKNTSKNKNLLVSERRPFHPAKNKSLVSDTLINNFNATPSSCSGQQENKVNSHSDKKSICYTCVYKDGNVPSVVPKDLKSPEMLKIHSVKSTASVCTNTLSDFVASKLLKDLNVKLKKDKNVVLLKTTNGSLTSDCSAASSVQSDLPAKVKLVTSTIAKHDGSMCTVITQSSSQLAKTRSTLPVLQEKTASTKPSVAHILVNPDLLATTLPTVACEGSGQKKCQNSTMVSLLRVNAKDLKSSSSPVLFSPSVSSIAFSNTSSVITSGVGSTVSHHLIQPEALPVVTSSVSNVIMSTIASTINISQSPPAVIKFPVSSFTGSTKTKTNTALVKLLVSPQLPLSSIRPVLSGGTSSLVQPQMNLSQSLVKVLIRPPIAVASSGPALGGGTTSALSTYPVYIPTQLPMTQTSLITSTTPQVQTGAVQNIIVRPPLVVDSNKTVKKLLAEKVKSSVTQTEKNPNTHQNFSSGKVSNVTITLGADGNQYIKETGKRFDIPEGGSVLLGGPKGEYYDSKTGKLFPLPEQLKQKLLHRPGAHYYVSFKANNGMEPRKLVQPQRQRKPQKWVRKRRKKIVESDSETDETLSSFDSEKEVSEKSDEEDMLDTSNKRKTHVSVSNMLFMIVPFINFLILLVWIFKKMVKVD